MCWSCDADSDAKPKRLKGMQRCSQSATNLRDASTLACHNIRVSRLFIPDGDDFFTSSWRLTGVIWQRGARFQPTVAQGWQDFANFCCILCAPAVSHPAAENLKVQTCRESTSSLEAIFFWGSFGGVCGRSKNKSKSARENRNKSVLAKSIIFKENR